MSETRLRLCWWAAAWLWLLTFGQATSGPAAQSMEAEARFPREIMEQALQQIGRQRYEDARRLIEPLARSRPELAQAHFVLGLTYHGEDRAQRARALFEEAVCLDGQEDLYRLYYGMCLFKLGELDDSRAVLVDYLDRNPHDSNALVAVGLIDFDQDRLDSARERLTTAVECAPTPAKQGRARKHLADVLVRLGELEAARDQLQRSIELNPADDRAYHRLANVLQRLGDVESAALARARMRSLHAAAAARGADRAAAHNDLEADRQDTAP